MLWLEAVCGRTVYCKRCCNRRCVCTDQDHPKSKSNPVQGARASVLKPKSYKGPNEEENHCTAQQLEPSADVSFCSPAFAASCPGVATPAPPRRPAARVRWRICICARMHACTRTHAHARARTHVCRHAPCLVGRPCTSEGSMQEYHTAMARDSSGLVTVPLAISSASRMTCVRRL